MEILSWPKWGYGALFGATAALIGVGVFEILSKLTKSEKFEKSKGQIILALAIVGGILPHQILPIVEKELAPQMVMKEWEKQRAFSLIFRYHPKAKEEVTERMKAILDSDANSDEVFLLSQQLSAELMAKYYNMHILNASDSSVHNVLKHNLMVTEKVRNNPEVCAKYSLGTADFSKGDIPMEIMQKELDLKADVIESSVETPSQPIPLNMDSMVEYLVEKYVEFNLDPQHLAKLDMLYELPPNEVCEVSYSFNYVLANLDTEESSQIYKNLMMIEEQ